MWGRRCTGKRSDPGSRRDWITRTSTWVRPIWELQPKWRFRILGVQPEQSCGSGCRLRRLRERECALAGGSSGTFTYLFGPRFNWRKSRVVPYAQFLFGGSETGLNGSLASTTRNGFATAAGGGIDIAVTKRVAVKPIQLEYITARPSSNSFQNNLRYSAGVVFRFGEK